MENDKKYYFIIGGEKIEAPNGLIVKNYEDDLEPKFKSKKFKEPPKWFILHETAGRTARGCKETLKRRKLGIHFIVDRDGIISQHADPYIDRVPHAKQMSDYSIGVEFVNPYAPKIAKGMPYKTIPARWWTWIADKNDKSYVLPTDKQLKTLELLVPFICEQVNIPYEFPTAHLNGEKNNNKVKRIGWRMKRIPQAPGVIAHQDTSNHADGRYLLEYLINKK
jgi:N-acetyl-anhydromuramyl-L-alanine amidase AmpD